MATRDHPEDRQIDRERHGDPRPVEASGGAGRGGPGAGAGSPREIPAAGWKAIALRTFGEIGRDRVMLVAAGVAFYGLLALVPALAAFIAIYGLVFEAEQIRQQIGMLEGFLPGGGMEILRTQIDRLLEQSTGTLGIALAVSVAISLWSANAAMKSLFEAMNVACEEFETRGFVRLTLTTLAFTLGAMLSVAALMVAMVGLPALAAAIDLGPAVDWLIRIGSFAAMVLLLFLGVGLLYRYGPARAPARWRWVTPGAIVAVVAAILASALFSWYTANFGSYNATYGSLGAIIGFMTWLWIVTIVIIVGAELDSEMEHQTARDTTTGPAEPIGRRGATVADRVAPPRG